jgi:hypothetical protein
VVVVVVWRWWGGLELRYWDTGGGGQCCVIEFFIRYLILWPLSNLLRFAGLSLWVSDGFQICWDLQVSLYLNEFYCIGVDCLKVVCKLRLNLPRLSFYRCSSTFNPRSCPLDSNRPVTFDSRSGVSV